MTGPKQSPEPFDRAQDAPVEGMIAVSVRYHNMLRRRIGVEQETIALAKGTSIRTTLEYLADRHGPHLREMFFAPEGSVASHLVIFRNRKLVPQDQHHLLLADGDELVLFPAIAGG
jgi:molybdopterin converting factor small subunit